MAGENQNNNDQNNNSKGDEGKGGENTIDQIPKKDYEDLLGRYSRIERLNQDLVADGEKSKQAVSSLQEELNKIKSEGRKNAAKGAQEPEEVQALIDSSVEEVTNQFSSKLTESQKTIESLSSQLKEYQIVGKLKDDVDGRVKKDMFPLLKEKALSQLQVDPANPDKIIVIDPASGKKVLSKKNPGTNMDYAEWLEMSEQLYPSMWEPKGVNNGTMPNGTQRQSSTSGGQQYTKETWLAQRKNVTDLNERSRLDKEFGY